MRRDLAAFGVARQVQRPARSIACLAFVGLMGVAFWAGLVWIAEAVISAPGIGL